MGRHQTVDTVLEVPQGRFELLRHPVRDRSTLRAWDAADAYVLRHLAHRGVAGRLAVLNDGFGALASGLHRLGPDIVADSMMAQIGVRSNLERNGLDPVNIFDDVESLPDGLGTVVVKVPKSLGQLEDQLHRLRPKLTPETVVVGAGMVRGIHTSTLELFEALIGSTTTSLAEQKARLIHAAVDGALVLPANPWPLVWEHVGITVMNRGGVFSSRSIDIGTRFLLEHLPVLERAPSGRRQRLVDLGCGNGIVGTACAAANDDIDLVFVDSSAQALNSAQQTWKENHGARPAEFHHADRLVNVVDRSSVDVVVVNPPFHDERAIGDKTAWDMFVDSDRVLHPQGELRVVGNRHLGYHSRLNKIFGRCTTIGSNKNFVVLSAVKA